MFIMAKVPKEDIIMSFSMLLNLVETSNATSKEILWKFVKKYKTNINEKFSNFRSINWLCN